jgi:hypothetical protein
MKVYRLTTAQRNQLVGHTYDGFQLFNTDAVDVSGEYYLGVEEYNNLTLVRANEIGVISWWFTLPEIEYNPILSVL